jgi:hypothetical protein
MVSLRRFASALLVVSLIGCSGGGKSASKASTTLAPTTTPDTTPHANAAEIDTVINQFIGIITGIAAKAVPDNTSNTPAVLAAIQSARKYAETGAKMTAHGLSGVPHSIVGPINAAFTGAADRIDTLIQCAEQHPTSFHEDCVPQHTAAATAVNHLGVVSGDLGPYGSRSGNEILALINSKTPPNTG